MVPSGHSGLKAGYRVGQSLASLKRRMGAGRGAMLQRIFRMHVLASEDGQTVSVIPFHHSEGKKLGSGLQLPKI